MGAPAKARSHDEILNRLQFVANHEIFHEGDKGDCAWLIESGRVLIVKDGRGGPVTLGELGPGEIFGELALIDDAPRMASAVTLDHSVLVPIARHYLQRRLAKADPFIARLLKILVQNVRSITDRHVETLGSRPEVTEAEANRIVESVLGKPSARHSS